VNSKESGNRYERETEADRGAVVGRGAPTMEEVGPQVVEGTDRRGGRGRVSEGQCRANIRASRGKRSAVGLKDIVMPKSEPTLLAISEAQLELAGTEYLVWDGWRAFKTDPVSNRLWGKGFGEKGMCDHLYLRYCDTTPTDPGPLTEGWGGILWIEWKRPKSKGRQAGVAKFHQTQWIMAERARGALVWLCGVDFPASYDGFLEHYQASRLQRKNIR